MMQQYLTLFGDIQHLFKTQDTESDSSLHELEAKNISLLPAHLR